MARINKIQRWAPKRIKKKTSIGASSNTKTGTKGGGPTGSSKSKNYKKKYRGQGK
mgnify:FL=1|tara:strand:+ start:399 stop:563 length:165 start_codon:yes stop_codon:yes gene_type:complete